MEAWLQRDYIHFTETEEHFPVCFSFVWVHMRAILCPNTTTFPQEKEKKKICKMDWLEEAAFSNPDDCTTSEQGWQTPPLVTGFK